jgi:hypothetical protein
MRFLVVGSSLRGVKDRPSPYKMTQQHLLPKFGPGKDADGKATASVLTATEEDGDGKDCEAEAAPGRQGAGPEAEEPKTHMPAANLNIDTESERDGSSLPGTADVVQEPLPDGRGSDACDSSPVRSEPRPPGSGSCEPQAEARGPEEFPVHAEPAEIFPAKAMARGGLVERLSHYAFWGRKNPFRQKPAVRKRATPVQGELLLEGVKVVRNDLNETDLEVVPTPKLPEKPVEQLEHHANAEPAKLAWRRIAARLFGGRRT